MILTKYANNLLMMKRYIDDIFGIWVPDDDNPKAWEEFKNDLPFGVLEWDVIERSRKVDFLDLTISINAEPAHRDTYLPKGHEPLPIPTSNIDAPNKRHPRHDIWASTDILRT